MGKIQCAFKCPISHFQAIMNSQWDHFDLLKSKILKEFYKIINNRNNYN